MKNQRQLKVHERRNSRWDESIPEILLKGKWLSHYGFVASEYVDVVCEDGRLIITMTKKRAGHIATQAKSW